MGGEGPALPGPGSLGSFHDSFVALTDLIHDLGARKRGDLPSSITILSGDVHHGYLAEATFHDDKVKSRIYQAVCSPLRNALPGKKSRLQNVAWTKPAALAGRLLSRSAGIEEEKLSWRLTHDRPWFENHVATLELEGKHARLTFERAVTDNSGEPTLEKVFEHRLA